MSEAWHEFWRTFCAYWAPAAVTARTDEWVSRFRTAHGLKTDWALERRIAARRKLRP